MEKNTSKLHQLLQSTSIAYVVINSFTFQCRINGVECDLSLFDHDHNPIQDYDIAEELAELLREEITSNNVLYDDIHVLFPKGVKVTDMDGTVICSELGMMEFEVEIGTDS